MTAPQTSTDNLTMSFSASGVAQYPGKGISGSTQKTSNLGTTNSGGGGGSGGSNGSNRSQSSQDLGGNNFEGPSLHPPTRLSSLQRCARMVTELATDKVGVPRHFHHHRRLDLGSGYPGLLHHTLDVHLEVLYVHMALCFAISRIPLALT